MLRYAEGELHREMLRLTRPRVEAYARYHGFAVREIALPVFDATFGWVRWSMIRQAFADGYDWAAYLESDVVIQDPAVDFRTATEARPLAMRYGGDPLHYQCGVIFARNTPEVRVFLDALLADTPHPSDALPEAAGGTWWTWPSCQQEAVRQMLHTEPWRRVVTKLDRHWNSVVGLENTNNAIIRAWHGTPGEKAKLLQMRQYLAQFDL